MNATLIAALSTALGTAHFNAHAGWKFYIATTAQNDDLDQTGYEALTWTQVTGVGSHGETGTTTNILTYDTWDTTVAQKAKGISNAGDPEVELARDSDDAGQIALRAAAAVGNNNSYAFKIEAADAPSGGTPTTRYNRGLVTGPRHPHGRNEDFDLEVYQLALQQEQIVVEAADAP